MLCRVFSRRVAAPLVLALCLPTYSFQAKPERTEPSVDRQKISNGGETLHYSVEWRLIEAGRARLSWTPTKTGGESGWQVDLQLESTGLVSKLYKVEDHYRVMLTESLCATSSLLKANEGRRQRETKVTYDRVNKKAYYLEWDLIKDAAVRQNEVAIPDCVHDVVGALAALRAKDFDPPASMQFPISDGKKFIEAKVEAQEKETIQTPAGSYKTIRYEAFLYNGVLYSKKGRLFVWLTDDERRMPVQIRIRLGFAVGTVTLQLEKEESS